MKPEEIETTREILGWIGDNQKRILEILDIALDHGDLQNPQVQSILEDASSVLNEIEEMEKEVTQML